MAINPLDLDNLVAVWRDFRLGHRRVGVGYTFDGGITWHDSLLEEPSYPRHSDPGITTDADGNFYVVILSYTGSTSEPNGLFVLKSEDGGVTWGDAVPAIDQVPNVFEDKELIACDRTGGMFDGNLYVAWARFGSSIEIMSVTSTDGGASFGGAVTVSDDGVVNVVFYDRRNDPSNLLMDLYLAQSFDGGLTFEPNLRVTTVSSDPTAGSGRAGIIGEYIGLAAASANRVHPVWTDTREGHQDVYTAIVDTTFVGVPDDGAVLALHLFPPSPNPSRGDALLHLVAPSARAVDVTICDVSGRLVREFHVVTGTDGACSVVWDGTDGAGERVASGVYFVRADDGASAATARLVHLK